LWWLSKGGFVPKRKPEPRSADNAEIDKLQKQLGFSSRKELISHALVLLQIAIEKSDSDGTIWIGKDDDAVGLCLRKQKK